MKTLLENFRRECERIENGGDFRDTPLAFRVPELNLIAVRKNGMNLSFCPPENIDLDIVKEAVSQNGMALAFVPSEMRTREVCGLAMKNDPVAFIHAPDEFLNEEIIKAALKKSGTSIHHIPEKDRTEELCLLAAQGGAGMMDIPNKYWSYNVILAMARNGKVTLEALSRFAKTKNYANRKEMCVTIAKNDIRNIRDIPRKILDEETCLEILRDGNYKGCNPLDHIPDRLMTHRMLEAIVDNGGCPDAIMSVNCSRKFISGLSPELARKCVRADPWNFTALPPKLRTEDVAVEAVRQPFAKDERNDDFFWNRNRHSFALENISTSERTEAVCMAAIESGRYNSKLSIPNGVKTVEMVRRIIEAEDARLEGKEETEERLLRMDELVKFVPERLLDREVYRIVLSELENVLQGSPRRLDSMVRKWQRKAEKAGLSFVDVPKSYAPV